MDSLKIPGPAKEIMIQQAFNELPNECCGLLVGRSGKIRRTLPMKNSEPSPDAYFMDPVQQVEVFTEMQKRDESLIGIYHSHPGGPAAPSNADLQLAFHPDAVYIIISFEDRNNPLLSGFRLKNGSFNEIMLI